MAGASRPNPARQLRAPGAAAISSVVDREHEHEHWHERETRGTGATFQLAMRSARPYSVRGPRFIFSTASAAFSWSGNSRSAAAFSRQLSASARRPVTRNRMPRL